MAKKCFVVAVLLLLFSIWCSSSAQYSGTVGFTDSLSPYSCSGIDPENYMVAAVSDELISEGFGCGTKFIITCVANSDNACLPSAQPITITVADDCKPEPPRYEECPTFVLSKQVYSAIANTDAGVVSVSYQLA